MGRPSKLSEAQWGEVLRLAAQGEAQAVLARRFRVSEGTISKRVSKDLETVKTLAGTIAKAETEFDAMPISQRIATRTLADQLKEINFNLVTAASEGSATAARLATAARKHADQIDIETLQNIENVATVMLLTETANKAAAPALALVQAQAKDKTPPAPGSVVVVTRMPDAE